MRQRLVVTDSSCCIPSAGRPDEDVAIVPLRIHTPTGELLDDPTIADEVQRLLADGESLKTSPPAPADYLLALSASGAEGAIIITPAREFTVMHRNALRAAAHASIPVHVLDTRTAASAQGLVVQAVRAALADGASIARAAAVGEDAARRVRLVATLEDLGHVFRAGHVPPDALRIGLGFGIQPVFRLDRGGIAPVAVRRDRRAALASLREHWHRHGGEDAGRATVFHLGSEDDAHQLAEGLDVTTDVVTVSPAMGVHTGPGVVGVAWMPPA